VTETSDAGPAGQAPGPSPAGSLGPGLPNVPGPSTQDAKNITAKVLQLAGVKSIVFVDDKAGGADEDFDLVAAVRDGSLGLDAVVGPDLAAELLDGLPPDTVGDAAAESLAAWLEEGPDDPERATARARGADHVRGQAAGDATETDASGPAAVGNICPRGVFEAVTPAQWAARRPELLSDPAVTLVLVDRDLDGARDDEGVDILADLLALPVEQRPRVALVTRHFTESQETSAATDIARERGLPADGFVVIAKARLEGNALEFPRRLLDAVLAASMGALVRTVLDAYRGGVDDAAGRLAALPPRAAVEVVLGAAGDDTVPETDVLLRILAALSRSSTRRRLRGDPAVPATVRALRDARAIRFPDAAADPAVWSLQRAEAYDDFDDLADEHSPLRPGDVFRVVAPVPHPGRWERMADDERYLLVAEAECDVAMRGNGDRSNQPLSLVVVEVRPGSPQVGASDGTQFELPRFCPLTGASATALLNRTHRMPALALDLAVVHPAGLSAIRPGETASPLLGRAWARAHKRLGTTVDRIAQRVEELGGGTLPDDVVGHLLTSLTGLPPGLDVAAQLVPTAGGTGIAFSLQRVARLRNPWATDVVAKIAARAVRVAYDARLEA